MTTLLMVRIDPINPEQPDRVVYCREVSFIGRTPDALVTVDKNGNGVRHTQVRAFMVTPVGAADIAEHIRLLMDKDGISHGDLAGAYEALVDAVLGDRD